MFNFKCILCCRAAFVLVFHQIIFLHFQAPAGTYSGMYDVYKHLMKTEGITALYKGFTPVMLRAFPANAVSIINWDFYSSFNRNIPEPNQSRMFVDFVFRIQEYIFLKRWILIPLYCFRRAFLVMKPA